MRHALFEHAFVFLTHGIAQVFRAGHVEQACIEGVRGLDMEAVKAEVATEEASRLTEV